MTHYLRQVIKNSIQQPIDIPLTENIVVIGSNDVKPQVYQKLSEEHALIQKTEDGDIFIRTLNSPYDIYVNGVRLVPVVLKRVKVGDIISFGVDGISTENGFVCILCKQPNVNIKIEPEIIDLVDDENDDDLPKLVIGSVQSVNSACPNLTAKNTVSCSNPDAEVSIVESKVRFEKYQATASTSKERTFVQMRCPIVLKKCSVFLIRCDSRYFPWPPDVKNPFLTQSEDEDILSSGKKRPRRISSDSSVESSDEDYSDTSTDMNSNSLVTKSKSKQNQFSNKKYVINSHLKRPKRINSDSSVSSSEEVHSNSSSKTCSNTVQTKRGRKPNEFSNNKYVTVRRKKRPKISFDSYVDTEEDNANSSTKWRSNSFPTKSESKKNEFSHKRSPKIIRSLSSVDSDNYYLSPSSETLSNSSLMKSKSKEKEFNHKKQVARIQKKRPKVLSSDSSDDSHEEDNSNFAIKMSLNSSVTKSENEQIQFSKHVSAPLEYQKNITSIRKNIDRRISFNSDETSETFSRSIPYKNQILLEKQSRNENSLLSNNTVFPKYSELCVQNVDKNVYLKKQSLKSSNMLSGRTEHLNSSNSLSIETTELKSSNTEVSKGSFQIFHNNVKKTTSKESHLKKHNYNETLRRTDNYSQAEEIIVISSDDDYFDIELAQRHVHIKSEPEDSEDFECNTIFKEIFELPDEPPNLVYKNSACENQEIESIETIKEFVNCSAPRNSLERYPESIKEQNSSVAELESEVSSEESYLPYTKRLILGKSKFDESKSSKILLTDPKPMPYRPRKMRARDEGFVEKQKSADPKSKREKSRKLITDNEEAINNTFVSSHKTEKKNTKSADKNLLTNSEPTQIQHSIDKKKNKNKPKEQESSVAFGLKTGERHSINSHLVSEKNSRIFQKQLPKKSRNEEKDNDYHKNSNLQSSSGIKDFRKSIHSVKVLPERFSSRMGFLTNEEKARPVIKNKITEKNKRVSVAEKNEEQQIRANYVASAVHPKQNKAIKKISPTEGFSSTSHIENKPTRQNKICPPHTLQSKIEQHNIPHNLDEDLNRIHIPQKENLPCFDLSLFGMLKSLFQFNAIWLEEQCKNIDPPSQVMAGVTCLPPSFTSFESYASSFYPLILLDIWQYMFEEFKDVVPHKKACKRFSFRVVKFIHKEDCVDIQCETVVNEKCYFQPHEGWMTVMEMNIALNKHYPLFGFIYRHKIEPLNLSLLHPCWKKTSAERLNNAKHCIFNAWIKSKKFILEPDILMKGNGICYIRNRLKLVDAIRYFKESPLMADIIKPRLSTYALSCSTLLDNLVYSVRQSEIIEAVCSEIYKPYRERKITLIDGPPGSGKTHLIIEVLKKLFYSSNYNLNRKVLVTAPSNVAIDEIGCRLIELNKRYHRAVKIVRVGVDKGIHPDVQRYTVDRLAADLYKRTEQLPKQQEKELLTLSLKISQLEKEPNSWRNANELRDLKKQYKCIKDQRLPENVHYLTMMKHKSNILKQSHIVLTTLSSSNHSILLKTFHADPKSNFSCCFVDESTQCSELEILQPLALGISKLVLIGDNKQLPAPNSEHTKRYQFDRSLFVRLRSYFVNTNQPSPVLYLEEQFRMHSSICEFPLMYTYKKKLDSHLDKTLNYNDFPLQPYFVLDVGQSCYASAIKDCDVLMPLICSYLVNVVDFSSSIGIIVLYEFQRFRWALQSSFPNRNIEVNTVNGFQGREKDVILLCAIDPNVNSSVESFISCQRKFNVALTRAKKCLIICLDSTTLRGHPHWEALIENVHRRRIYSPISCLKDIELAFTRYKK